MKSQIRKAIENILEKEFSTCYIDPTNKAKTKYRMKLKSDENIVTSKQKAAIEKLPHVLKVGFIADKPHNYFLSGGITIHFDFPVSLIRI